MSAQQLTEAMASNAFREAAEAMAKDRRATRTALARWTPEIDAEILRANVELGLGARPIAAIMRKTYGWGCRSSVEDRLRNLKAASK